MPPLTKTAPVIRLVEFVVSEKFPDVLNNFQRNEDVPKSNPLVPGTKAAVPELSLKVTRVVVPPTDDPGEKEALYPVTDIAFNASPFIEIDWGLPVLSFQ